MAKEKKTKVSITQVKSTISQTSRQKKTITALGLGKINKTVEKLMTCLLYTSPSPRDKRQSRMPSSA